MTTLYDSGLLIGCIAGILFSIVIVTQCLLVRRAQRLNALRLRSVLEFWSWMEHQESKTAESDACSMVYPVHTAKASVYRRCIADVETAIENTEIRK